MRGETSMRCTWTFVVITLPVIALPVPAPPVLLLVIAPTGLFPLLLELLQTQLQFGVFRLFPLLLRLELVQLPRHLDQFLVLVAPRFPVLLLYPFLAFSHGFPLAMYLLHLDRRPFELVLKLGHHLVHRIDLLFRRLCACPPLLDLFLQRQGFLLGAEVHRPGLFNRLFHRLNLHAQSRFRALTRPAGLLDLTGEMLLLRMRDGNHVTHLRGLTVRRAEDRRRHSHRKDVRGTVTHRRRDTTGRQRRVVRA
jgi:hypothetical protein